jgi:transcriptional regulator with XRE-family HTH domain
MRKALRISGKSVQEMADYLGVAPTTVSTWINGRNRPSPSTIRLWAMSCGVAYEWLAGDGLRRGPTRIRFGLGLAA